MKINLTAFLPVLSVLVIATKSEAAKADQQVIHCLDAGGYYGNIQITTNKSKTVKIDAQQGFAYEISSQLGSSPGHEAYRFTIQFDRSQCVWVGESTHCLGWAQIRSWNYEVPLSENFKTHVDFRLFKTSDGHVSSLALQLPGSQSSARASHLFISPTGSCE